MAGTPIDNKNLPKGVSIDPNTGGFLITNDKGQVSRVAANSQEQLNTYATSWQTGQPATVTVTRIDGSTKEEVYNPGAIVAQQQASTDYAANLKALKKANILPDRDGVYRDLKGDGHVLTDAEVQERLSKAGLPPSALDLNAAKPNINPNSAEVKASNDAVNNVTNNPSSLTPAPAPPASGTVNSPLGVDSATGATTVSKSAEPSLSQNAYATAPTPAANSTTGGPNEDAAENARFARQNNNTIENSAPAANPMGQDPAQRAQVADQIAIDKAQTISTVQDPQQAAQAKLNAAPDVPAANPMSQDPAQRTKGISAPKQNAQSGATQQDAANFKQLGDWRVRLSLAPNATCLYKDPNVRTNQSILLPLVQTDGVIFPYTPAIAVSYVAEYAATTLTHTNYAFNSYVNSKVENITIGCDFTAQDTAEATYLLAVIHFFRSATKMFYGQDNNPKNGTPPPLCYLNGLGAFQFDEHPLAITAFNYTLPTDVDYIRAGIPTTSPGVNKAPQTAKSNAPSTSGDRMNNNNLSPGGRPGAPVFSVNYSTKEPTYVPTRISLSITAVPIVTRNDVSNNFSLQKYATGELLRGSKRAGGGFW